MGEEEWAGVRMCMCMCTCVCMYVCVCVCAWVNRQMVWVACVVVECGYVCLWECACVCWNPKHCLTQSAFKFCHFLLQYMQTIAIVVGLQSHKLHTQSRTYQINEHLHNQDKDAVEAHSFLN